MNTYAKYCPNVFVAACDEQHSRGDIIEMTTARGKTHDCEVWNFLGQKSDGKYLYSITRTDGTNHQTRAAARAQKYDEWSAAAQQRSNDAFQRSENAVANIPFGQPILVGHHSESAHRNAIKRSQAAMFKCVEESDKAKSHEHKSEYWERKAEVVDLSMPESIEYFEAELAKAEEYHAGVKSGKYPRLHAYTLTYAKKAVNELRDKVATARKLWGDPDSQKDEQPRNTTTPTDNAPDPANQKNCVSLQGDNNDNKTTNKSNNTMSNRQKAADNLVPYLTDEKIREYINASHFDYVGKWIVAKPNGMVYETVNPIDTAKNLDWELLQICTSESYNCDCELCAPFKVLGIGNPDSMTPEQVKDFERIYGLSPAELKDLSVLDLYNPEALAELIEDYRTRAAEALANIPQGFFSDEQ